VIGYLDGPDVIKDGVRYCCTLSAASVAACDCKRLVGVSQTCDKAAFDLIYLSIRQTGGFQTRKKSFIINKACAMFECPYAGTPQKLLGTDLP
jgi:hypothetical protein